MKKTIAVSLSLVVMSGCAGPLRPVFEKPDTSLQWPRPPDQARIRYIGQLTGEESLHARRKGLDVLGEVFTGPKPKAAFSTPTAVAVAGERVYVADGQNHAVFLLDLESRLFKTIHEAAGGPLHWPADAVIADDRLVIADSARPGVFFYDLDGNYLQSLESRDLKRPCGVAWNSATRSLWVVDAAEHRLSVFDVNGAFKKHVGRRGSADGEFNFPAGIGPSAAKGAVVTDSMNFRIQVIDAQGKPEGAFGKKGDAAGDFAMPRDAAVDSDGHIYVLDNQFENIQIFEKSGQLLMALGEEGRAPGQFYLPSGITIDEHDRIWVADTYNRRVQVFQYLKEPAP